MSDAAKNKDESVSSESEDDFQFEEVSLEDNWSLAEGEEDLEAVVKAVKERSEASAAAAPGNRQPESVDHFLRRFLVEMGMVETLDCFQSEWSDMTQKGLVDKEQIGVVSDVYADIMRLHSELKNAQREEEECRLGAYAAAATLDSVQKARDFHRMKHNRVVQERNRLIEEMKKLKVQCDSYETELQRMEEKCDRVQKQTLQMTSERDEAAEEEKRRTFP
ncbi:sperm-associated antigen 16 protein [Brachionichthys hirsutus]|uniref:sperm-associated antigen 16 protein n=1 Tax=Brachionichthys hirsutus TaxID=412623 RepID=UPI0036052205